MVGGLWLSSEGWVGAVDPAEEVAIVARARRELLLRAHRFRLRREDLEDCYSQATLELVVRARRGGVFNGSTGLESARSPRSSPPIRLPRTTCAGGHRGAAGG